MKDLQKGATLIEASAGTGKTYTLCRLALQLTLEKGITLDRILAVTFTEAATEELAARIHELYQACLHQLDTNSIEEELLQQLALRDDFDWERAKRALRYSLEVFDEAPISTIHGFCKRSLELIALETRSPLDAELVPVEDALVEQLQAEYIRERILEASPALSLALPSQSEFQKRLSALGRQSATHPSARVHPVPEPVSTESLDRRLAELPGKIGQLLGEVDAYLPHLRKGSKIRKSLEQPQGPFSRIAQRGRLLPEDLKLLPEFDEEKWKKALNKSGAHLDTPAFVSDVGVLIDQLQGAFAQLVFQYPDWLRHKIEDAKQRANIITFNDLLHLLRRALERDEDGALAQLVSQQYDAALIDEFQDTDRVQLQIAQTLFGQGEHYLFYIGDPKQSIYRFRGADIYAYFAATQQSGAGLQQIPLTRNYRSCPPLVAAVNHLFQNAKAGFADARIQFIPVEAARSDLVAPFATSVPFHIEQLRLEEEQLKRAPGMSDYRQVLARRAANDFARRLKSDARLSAGDVTFLVNNHREADALSAALLQRGIASAIRADRSVFQSEEAEDLKQLLAALAAPSRNSLKRGAYAGLDRSIHAVDLADDEFETAAAPFFEYISEWARSWEAANFDVCFRRLLALLPPLRQGAEFLDSERRLANLYHLAELLSEEQSAEDLSPLGLLNWLNRQQRSDASRQDDWQTRLTSEDGKPQILTVHKSKGLQFPLVVLPFVGLRRIRNKEMTTTYHDAAGELVIDLAPDSASETFERARRESLAEDIRLLYVALTRAEFENHLYLCPEEISSRSQVAGSSFAQFVLNEGETASSAQVAEALQALADSSGGALSFQQSAYDAGPYARRDTQPPLATKPAAAQTLANRDALPGPERVLSFSALSKFAHFALEASALAEPDSKGIDDEPPVADAAPADEAETVEQSRYSIFTLPKGTKAGDLLHLILERYDFTRPDTLSEATRNAFEELNFKPRAYEPIVATQIGIISKTDLPSPFGPFSLSEIPPKDRLAELEFTYPISGDSIQAIAKALGSKPLGKIPPSWAQRFARLSQPLDGSMLRGFIDLVLERDGRLYIVDWKSNYLGAAPSSYDEAAMSSAMAEHDYFLQYLLYAVALKRYLAWRYPKSSFEERFGGVYYIFARGVSLGKDSGIFFDRPDTELIDELDRALATSHSPLPPFGSP